MKSAAASALWGLAEVVALAALFEAGLWILGPHVAEGGWPLAVYWVLVGLAAAVILWISPFVLHHDPPSLRGWGWGRQGNDPGRLANAWPSYLIVTAAAGAAIVAAVAIFEPARFAQVSWTRFAAKLTIYLAWGPVQALVFFGWLQTRLRTAVTSVVSDARVARPVVALAVAGLFAAAHAPNWPLAALVLGMGLVWSWLFWARPNVLLMGLSHGSLGTIVYVVLGLFTRIGPFYAHPEGWVLRYAIPGLHDLFGDLF